VHTQQQETSFQAFSNEQQRHFRKSTRTCSNDGIHRIMCIIHIHRSTYSRFRIMTKSTDRRQPERQKVVAERLNGQLAMLGLVAASISYVSTGHMFFGLV